MPNEYSVMLASLIAMDNEMRSASADRNCETYRIQCYGVGSKHEHGCGVVMFWAEGFSGQQQSLSDIFNGRTLRTIDHAGHSK